MPRYKVTRPSYRQGVFLNSGDIIDVPEKDASRTWVKLDDVAAPSPGSTASAAAVDPPPEPPRRRARASDAEPSQ